MGQLNFWVPGSDDDAKAIRQQLNQIAAGLGYTAKAGPGGSGGSAALLVAIATGAMKVMPGFTVQVPATGWDGNDYSVLVELPIDDETFLSVDLIERRLPYEDVAGPLPAVYSVRHAVVVRYEDNSEVRQVSPREIELVA